MNWIPKILVCSGLLFLAACAPVQSGTSMATTPIVITGSVSTASLETVEPVIITELPPDYTPPPTAVLPSATPIPTLAGGLGPSELKYRVLAEYPDLFFCDPDYYPVAFEDELVLAQQRFPALQANSEEFTAILAHNSLADRAVFTDEQKLLIYRAHKKLAAVPFTFTGEAYQFQIQAAETEGAGELITGMIDGQGSITEVERTPSFAACPICLAAGTLIDTPAGPLPVEKLTAGMLVWTVDAAGLRVAQPLVQVGKTFVPTNHHVIQIRLDDGREFWASPGHPTADGKRIGRLKVGDPLDGGKIVSTQSVRYTGTATYDLLPDGDTGYYRANGVLLASTLKADTDLP